MPHYHFNIFDGVASIDQEGTQLPGTTEAMQTAMRYAADVLREEACKPILGEEWRVEVTDGRGMILFRIDMMLSASPALGQV